MNRQITNHLKWLLLLTSIHGGYTLAAERQDTSQIQQTAESFLRTQTAGLPGKVTVNVNKPDARANLAPCAALEAFMPNGSRSWGKTTVGVRCLAPSNWTVYLPARVHVIGDYVAAAVALKPGQDIGAENLLLRSGDLGELPGDVVTDPAQAIGLNMISGLAPGAPVRRELLRAPQAVQQGQTTRLVVSGSGFVIHSEGRALANANVGQMVQVRTETGQLVSGIARADHVVDVPF
jgi:flagellar basal body P-ring formation protein FlgA